MKRTRMTIVCALMAGLALSGGNLLAQDNGGGPAAGPGGQAGGFGGPAGGFGGAGGGFGGMGGGNFDPAQMQQQMQQYMMQSYQQQLGITNDTEWSAVKPLVQKVMDAQNAARGNVGAMFGLGGFGGPGGPGGFGQQTDPDAAALQQALDGDAPTTEIKELLAKYRASQKTKQAALTAAQDDLRKVLSARQEARATLMGLLN
jgi:hypothetical protein